MAKLLPTPMSWHGRRPGNADTDNEERTASSGNWHRSLDLSTEVAKLAGPFLPTPRASTNRTSRRAFAIDHWSAPSLEQAVEIADGILPRELENWEDIRGRGGQTWQDYAGAIERHATLVEAPPPSPVNDAGKLSPAFVEWMMTLPPGWVTELDLPRTTQLKILGNGVLPIQAETAYSSLLVAL